MKQLNLNISLLRILATLAVVFLHTCCTISLNPDLFRISNNQEQFLRVGHYLCLWAVPVFFMISGHLLLGSNREVTYGIVLKKYVSRIFGALVIFGIPFAIVKIYLESHGLSVGAVVEAFLGNSSFAHLWYLYTLIGIYLVLPVLKPAVKNVSDRTLLFFLVVLFVFDFLRPVVSYLCDTKIAFTVPFSYAIFYFVAGYFVGRNKTYCPRSLLTVTITLMATLIVLLTVLGRYKIVVDEYISPIVALLAICIFRFFTINEKITEWLQLTGEKTRNVIWKMDRLCFAVYLIHPLFIQFVYRFLKVTPCSFEYYYLMVFAFFGVFCILSYVASFVLNKIPFLGKYIL